MAERWSVEVLKLQVTASVRQYIVQFSNCTSIVVISRRNRASSFPGPFPYPAPPARRGREKALGTRMGIVLVRDFVRLFCKFEIFSKFMVHIYHVPSEHMKRFLLLGMTRCTAPTQFYSRLVYSQSHF